MTSCSVDARPLNTYCTVWIEYFWWTGDHAILVTQIDEARAVKVRTGDQEAARIVTRLSVSSKGSKLSINKPSRFSKPNTA